MINGIHTWFKNLSDGWRSFSLTMGFVIAVATSAVAIDHFKDRVVDDHELLRYLHKSDSTRTREIKDVLKRLDTLSDTVHLILNNQKKMTNSYATFVQDNTLSVPEFMKYMNGMEFTVIQSPGFVPVKNIEEIKPNFKIKVLKIKK